jgi:probable F420-dependent oxidoreductase
MKIHLVLPNFGPGCTASSIGEIAVAGERLGFDAIATTDHVLVPKGEPERYERIFESLTVLGYLSAITSHVGLMTSVIVPLMRNPFVVAKQAATVDQLSGGRLTLGLGVGWVEQEFANVHADFRRRGARFDELLRLYRHLFSGSREPFEGEFYGFEDGVFDPLPVHREHLPILLGGTSDAAVRRAARTADIWQATQIGPAEWQGRVALLRSQAGGRPVEVGARIVLTGDPVATSDELRVWQDAGADHVLVTLGFTEGFLGRMEEFAELMQEVQA